MPNPRLLLCDTDSLIQLFLTRLVTKKLLPLRVLRDEYGIQPAIVEEVETELMWTRRYKDQFAPELKKALAKRYHPTSKCIDICPLCPCSSRKRRLYEFSGSWATA